VYKTLVLNYDGADKIDLPNERPRLSKRSNLLQGEDDAAALHFDCSKTPIAGDIKIEFYDKKVGGKPHKESGENEL
jgi:hypothetical protein